MTDLEKVRQNGRAIRHIKYPSEKVKLAATWRHRFVNRFVIQFTKIRQWQFNWW